MEGSIFKAFIESRGLNKTKLAKDLGMSKQNLYQLFESKVLQPETIDKIERKFRLKWEKIKQSVNIDVPRDTTKPQEPQKNGKEDYLSGKNLENFSEAHRQLATAIAHALPESRQDRVMAPSLLGLIEEIVSGKKQFSVDELKQELKKALAQNRGYR